MKGICFPYTIDPRTKFDLKWIETNIEKRAYVHISFANVHMKR